MIMTDGHIQEAVASGYVGIEHFSLDCLKPTSYDARVGERLLRAGDVSETDMRTQGDAKVRPGEFIVFTTRESFRLPHDIAGHLGSKTGFTHRGLVLLCGQHIDPGFCGVLVLGAYNASPKPVAVQYGDQICSIEFHRLSEAVRTPLKKDAYPEHLRGQIPRGVKDYFRDLPTEPVGLKEQLDDARSRLDKLEPKVNISIWLIGLLLTAMIAQLANLFFKIPAP